MWVRRQNPFHAQRHLPRDGVQLGLAWTPFGLLEPGCDKVVELVVKRQPPQLVSRSDGSRRIGAQQVGAEAGLEATVDKPPPHVGLRKSSQVQLKNTLLQYVHVCRLTVSDKVQNIFQRRTGVVLGELLTQGVTTKTGAHVTGIFIFAQLRHEGFLSGERLEHMELAGLTLTDRYPVLSKTLQGEVDGTLLGFSEHLFHRALKLDPILRLEIGGVNTRHKQPVVLVESFAVLIAQHTEHLLTCAAAKLGARQIVPAVDGFFGLLVNTARVRTADFPLTGADVAS